MYSLLYFTSLFIVFFAQPSKSLLLCSVGALVGFALFWVVYRKIKNRKTAFILSTVWFFCIELGWQSWLCSTKYQGYCMPIVYVGICILFALQFSLVSLFLYKRSIGIREILLIPSAWTLMEMSRIFILSGHLWSPVGLALSGNHYSMQLASLGGVYLLSFWVMLVNVCFLGFIEKKSFCFPFAVLGLFPFVFGFVSKQIYKNEKKEKDFTVLMVQTGLYPEERTFFSEFPEKAIRPLEQWKRIFSFIKEKNDQDIDLLILPEGALPFASYQKVYPLHEVQEVWKNFFDEKDSFFRYLKKPYAENVFGQWYVSNAFINQMLANVLSCEVICGMDHREMNSNYNSGFHFVPNESVPNRYDKQVLVPIGEYLPFSFLQDLASQFGILNFFEKGSGGKVFSKNRPFSISICLEEIYPSLMRENRQMGANYFVNISNDSWFPESTLSSQHFDHGILRAVENGVYLFRCCCTGVTGAIDPFGRTIETLGLSPTQAGALLVSVPFYHHRTLYSFFGDRLILGICFLVCLLELRRVISKTGLRLA